jgi:drug/metabolite transporter (DMT)-like permease
VAAGYPDNVALDGPMTAIAALRAPGGRRHSAHTLGIFGVLGATMFWSVGGVLGKATAVTGVVLGFWRLWIATVVMSIVVVATRQWPTRADIRRSAPMGVLFGLNICAFFITLQYVSIAVALIIGALTPVVALPIAVVFLGERLTTLKVVCAVAAVGGVVAAVLTAPATNDGHDTAIGYVWAVASLLIWVTYIFISKRARRQVETVRLMWIVSFIGALTLSVIAVGTRAELGSMHGVGWVWATLLAIGPGLAGHGLFVWAQPRVDSSVSSVLIQGEPVGASIAAWVFLGQTMSVVQGVAMAVVLAALCTLAYREARDRQVAPDDARV